MEQEQQEQEQEQQASPKFLGWDGTRGLKFVKQTYYGKGKKKNQLLHIFSRRGGGVDLNFLGSKFFLGPKTF